jgi:hypothetical protein
MKTIKYISTLSLVLIFAGITAVYATNKPTRNSGNLIKKAISYEVRVHLQDGAAHCNKYLVQVTDENGNLVAPAKLFVPGTSRYIFSETTSVQMKTRIASLILWNGDLNDCEIKLVAEKDIRTGQFLPGQTYWFDLYPMVVKDGLHNPDATTTGIQTEP